MIGPSFKLLSLLLARVNASIIVFLNATSPIYANDIKGLTFIEDYNIYNSDLGPTEPSGLDLRRGSSSLWIVSDGEKRLYEFDLSGKRLRDHWYSTAFRNLEGIAETRDGKNVLALSEDRTEIVLVDLETGIAQRHKLTGMKGAYKIPLFGYRNDGLEGITFDQDDSTIYVIKERNPRLLINISSDLSEILSVAKLTASDGFARDGVSDRELDVSGLAMDPIRKGIWILSDTGRAVFFRDSITKQAQVFPLTYSRDHMPLNNPEGVAVSLNGDELYVVTDDGRHSRLVRYRID